MIQINPHINFNGNAEEAFHFYRSVFGGEITNVTRFRDIASDEFPVSEIDANKIMNIKLPIGNNFLIANDVPEFMWRTNEDENRSKISITTGRREEALNVYRGLSAGGQVEVPMDEDSDGSCFAMFRDKYGIEWIIEYNE